jgi:putative ABC transport system permease protein
MGTFRHDLIYALRMLRKNPWTSVAAIVALALGIGANTAIFSVINGTLLKPLPFPESDRIVLMQRSFPGGNTSSVSIPRYQYWRDQSESFQSYAAYDVLGNGMNLTGDGPPERIVGFRVTHGFFDVMGIRPLHGRGINDREDIPGAPRVAVLSHGLWQRRFGGDLRIVGQTINLNGETHEVVGIMPPSMRHPTTAELWTGLQLDPASQEKANYLFATARLKPGVTLGAAQAEADAIGIAFKEFEGDGESEQSLTVNRLQEVLFGDLRPAFLVLFGAVGLVLLIACANVANLQLARSAARQAEMGIRSALGAGKKRIIRQLLTESVVLALVGGGLGIALCAAAIPSILALAPPASELAPSMEGVTLDVPVLLFGLLISLLTGLLFGLAPAFQASRVDLNAAVKEGTAGAGSGRGGQRLRLGLVVVETALALVLLVGAGIMLKSFAGLRSTDPGFDTKDRVTMKLALAEQRYQTPADLDRLSQVLLPEIKALPGVKNAAFTMTLPTEPGPDLPFAIEGRFDMETGEGIGDAQYRSVSPAFFETLGIRLMAGRTLEARDNAQGVGVALINETAARRFWPDSEALGARITMGGPFVPELSDPAPREIIGIVQDVREMGVERDAPAIVYVPISQMPDGLAKLAIQLLPASLVVQGTGDPMPLVGAVKATVLDYDPAQPVSEIATLEEIMTRSLGSQRFNMTLLGILAGLALVLSAVGIYGVLAYLVGQRTREIGIRMALGANRSTVVRLVLRQGMTAVALGIGIGVVVALGANRLMSSLVFGVSLADPVAFAVVASVLALVALAATYLPGRRAARVNPVTALRSG